ncbi:hypothetical protein IT157_01895 [bacterium]|nr:hypothetical protein [bacterium]
MRFLNTRVFLTALLMTATAIFIFQSCSSSGDGGGDDNGQAKWTIMVYGAGNNDLDQANNNTSYIVQDVQDMEKVGSQSGMNIISMVSRYNGGGNAKYYKLGYYPSENPDQISSEELLNLGTKDMSDPATMREFINYCKANYPADNYLLLVDDHGAGWPGSCVDEVGGAGSLLTNVELRQAIAQSDLGRVDILTWHACLMAMVEVAYEFRNVADYMTGCQFTMPMENILGADIWLGWLKDNLDASPDQFARKIAESVRERAEFKQKTTQYGMIALGQMNTLGSRVGAFGNILVQEGGQYWNEVQAAWQGTHSTQYDNQAYVDLREFANRVKQQEHLQNSNLIRTAADDVISAINAAVPFTNSYFYGSDPVVPRGGLNIHFPYQMQQFDSSNYVTLEFRATNWQSFLSTFLRSGAQAPTGRCCYNNNTQCADVTQAECQTVNGTWTQGATCNDGCGGGDPTGRCCYNSNQSCQDVTQTQCNGLAGTWTGGVTCAAGCGGGGQQCATSCETAVAYTPGNIVSNCTVQNHSTNWFSTTLGVGTWRFQLVAASGDFDIYTYADDCVTQLGCYGEAQGDEDFTCNVQGSAVTIRVMIYAYDGQGGYQFAISQVGIQDDPHAMKLR